MDDLIQCLKKAIENAKSTRLKINGICIVDSTPEGYPLEPVKISFWMKNEDTEEEVPGVYTWGTSVINFPFCNGHLSDKKGKSIMLTHNDIEYYVDIIIHQQNRYSFGQQKMRFYALVAAKEPQHRDVYNYTGVIDELKTAYIIELEDSITKLTSAELMRKINEILLPVQLYKIENNQGKDYYPQIEAIGELFSTPEFTFKEADSIVTRADLPIEILKFVAQEILNRNLLKGSDPNVIQSKKKFFKNVIFKAKTYKHFRELIRP